MCFVPLLTGFHIYFGQLSFCEPIISGTWSVFCITIMVPGSIFPKHVTNATKGSPDVWVVLRWTFSILFLLYLLIPMKLIYTVKYN